MPRISLVNTKVQNTRVEEATSWVEFQRQREALFAGNYTEIEPAFEEEKEETCADQIPESTSVVETQPDSDYSDDEGAESDGDDLSDSETEETESVKPATSAKKRTSKLAAAVPPSEKAVISEKPTKKKKGKRDKLKYSPNDERAPTKRIVRQDKDKRHHQEPFKNKKTSDFRDAARKRRDELGIMLLSKEAEKKIYKRKVAMRAQGKSAEEIRTEIRKMRRAEENALLRKLKKRCFLCKSLEHQLIDCPKNDNKQCFKCGSKDHGYKDCLQKHDSGFAGATCFICGERGHISRDCKQNDLGAFPKGGACLFCGSIRHKKVDCPERRCNQRPKVSEDDSKTADVVTKLTDSVEYVRLKTASKPTSVLPGSKKKVVKF